MGKRFDPFADGEDDLEYQPDGASSLIESPARPPSRKIVERTAVQSPPKKKDRPLRLDFDELKDQGGDIRGATAIGSEKLGADDFLRGMKKADYDDALQRARSAQLALPISAVQETRIGRKVNTPIYLLIAGIFVFILLLVAGGYGFQWYLAYQDKMRLEALQNTMPSAP